MGATVCNGSPEGHCLKHRCIHQALSTVQDRPPSYLRFASLALLPMLEAARPDSNFFNDRIPSPGAWHGTHGVRPMWAALQTQ